ncbi:hypothetical protein BJ875DRAFT_125350 [Amylocarpus encephaloides]|uniref:DUF7053 domain-containing protein n=1 Tax=Amylocarpus encephaloides TaxID=45428 RepID=A0A9P7YQ48_9HELO|nr:hypothetical protein BJ875DRAFT_125350 [Amylocarpus encephaloides]
MASFLNTSHTAESRAELPSHVTKWQVIAVLHDPEGILSLNPIIKSYVVLPPASSVSFYQNVVNELKPSTRAEIEKTRVFSVIEGSGDSKGEDGDTWRGGWAQMFVPDQISYETSYQQRDGGAVAITHAPMGVRSVTHWSVEEIEGRLMIAVKLVVTSNRMLMGFIKTTLQASINQLSGDFVKAMDKKAGERAKDESTAEVQAIEKAKAES